MSDTAPTPPEAESAPPPPTPDKDPAEKKPDKGSKDYGNPFTGFTGFVYLLQAIWVGIWNPFGLVSYIEAKNIVKHQYGIGISRGKIMYMMPTAMMTLYCLVAFWLGAPITVLGPTWWFTVAVCIYTTASDIETKWLAIPIGVVIALAIVIPVLVTSGILDLTGVLGSVFEYMSLEYPIRGAIFLGALIVIWNFADLGLNRVTDIMRLINNNYDRGRLSKDGDYPAGGHRTHSHITDWLEWGWTFAGSIGLKSIYGDRQEREDDKLDTAVVVLRNVPMAGLLKRAFSYATSSAAVERRG